MTDEELQAIEARQGSPYGDNKAREDIPALIAEVRALQDLNQAMSETLAHLQRRPILEEPQIWRQGFEDDAMATLHSATKIAREALENDK